MTRKWWRPPPEPVPDDEIKPGGIRERAMATIRRHEEDRNRTKASAAHWRKVRESRIAIEGRSTPK